MDRGNSNTFKPNSKSNIRIEQDRISKLVNENFSIHKNDSYNNNQGGKSIDDYMNHENKGNNNN